ncbi:hypothetical protein Poli38472_013426 [Pythium oligandrum]|uniref:NmrA-like domain-containing protein n=1 Tax=Pythium oligandrum TaxID=41045 RepID=A0A8K1C7G7_PYTOL|nr:hypothetical protein Poli38472_013426 [Pythium oligandrum]|eukprot:TMW57952.1 hypothetical protein Poli38472_013426 [Pythium oligandrum]
MSTTKLTTGQILVTGASGELGKLTLHHLIHTVKINPKQIVAGSRSPDKLKEFADQGVQVRFVDFADPASIGAAAQGVERAMLISARDFDGGESHKTAVREFIKAGVQHILYTSVQAVDRSVAMIATIHRATEIFIEESEIPGYTLLRNGMYYENNFPLISIALKNGGKWLTAAKDGKISMVSRDDTARSGAYALARDVKERKIYEITGPELLSIDEIVAQVSEAVEQPLEVAQVSEDELVKGIAVGLGLPEFVGQIYASIDKNTAAGLAEEVTDHYKQLTGVDPITHRTWAQKDMAILKAL